MTKLLNRFRVEILIALLVIVIAGPLVHEYKAQQASRYLFTAAMWDDGTIILDRYAAVEPPILGVDRAVYGGHTLSDKAPLQPLLAVPFYAAYRAAGGEPAIERRIDENLGLWWVTFWMSTVPTAVLAVLIYRFTRRYFPETSLIASLGIVTGSILLPFAAVLFGHALAALFVFGAFFLATADPPTAARLAGAGALCGAAVAAEYTAAPAVFVLAAYVLWRARSSVGWFVAGGLPAVIGLAWYHTVAFGSPLTHPYRYSAFSEVTEESRPFFSIFSSFHPERLAEVFFQGRGFVFAAPLIVVGLYGLARMVRRGESGQKAIAATSLAMFLAFLLIPLFWGNPWGGDSPGPRYMTPALAFMALGVAYAWPKLRLLGPAALAVGSATMLLATLTDPLINRAPQGGIGMWIQLAGEGDLVPTIFTIAVGPVGWLVHVAVLGLVIAALVRTQQTKPAPETVAA